jgi:uncharacterized protein YijF (DUF1287 family)
VLNLEAFFQRSGACQWRSTVPTSGDGFPKPLELGDIVTWLLDARLPHIGIIVATPGNSSATSSGVNTPPPNRRWLRFRLKAGLIGHTAD